MLNIPTREQVNNIILGMIKGDIPTRVGAYWLLKETHGTGAGYGSGGGSASGTPGNGANGLIKIVYYSSF